MKSVNHYKRRLSRSCYFRRMSREEENCLLNSFSCECSVYPRDNIDIFEKYKGTIKNNYKINFFVFVPFVLSVISILSSFLYSFELLMLEYGIYISASTLTFILHIPIGIFFWIVPLSLVYTFLGVIIGKIKLRNYRYNWLVLIIQCLSANFTVLFMLYTIAKDLDKF